MQAIDESSGKELERLTGNAVSIRDQTFIRTATTGLSLWEVELGIPIDLDKPIGERRSVVEAKMRGVGTVTPAMVERVAQSYERGDVRVTQRYSDYTFIVTFIGTLGTPPNIDDLKAAIEEIKPAHLDVEYAYRYLRIKEIHNVMTIAQMNQTKLDKFAGGAIPDVE